MRPLPGGLPEHRTDTARRRKQILNRLVKKLLINPGTARYVDL